MLRLTAGPDRWGTHTIDLDDWTDGITVPSFEVGGPALREVTFDRQGADGTDDHTRYVGARICTAAVAIARGTHTRRALLDRMAPFLIAGRRITVHYSEIDGDPVRRLVVTPVPFDVAWTNPGVTDLTWSFKTTGEPWWLGEERTVDLAPAPPPPGFTFPLTFPLTFPDTPDTLATAFNAGSYAAAWVWTIDGPVARPCLRNETTGEQIVTTLTLLDGQTAVIDGATQQITVDGETRHSVIDHAATTWWRVPPGAEVAVRMPVASASGDADGVLVFSDTFYA